MAWKVSWDIRTLLLIVEKTNEKPVNSYLGDRTNNVYKTFNHALKMARVGNAILRREYGE